MEARCREIVRRKGVKDVTVENLVTEITTEGRANVPGKMYYDDYEDDGRPMSIKSKNNEGGSSVWQSSNTSKRRYRRKQKKSLYHQDDRSHGHHDDRSNEYRSRHSEREEYYRSLSRLSEEDDYRRLNDNYHHSRVEEYAPSISPRRYEQSPVYDLPPSPLNLSPSEYSELHQYLESGSPDQIQSSTMRESYSNVAPALQAAAIERELDIIENVTNELNSLPPKLFLKVVASRLNNWTSTEMDREQLGIHLKINDLTKQIAIRCLPSEIQALFRGNEGPFEM